MCKRVYPSQGPVAAVSSDAQVSDSGSSCWTEKEAGVGHLRLLLKSPGRWTTETLITVHINRAVVLFLGVFYHQVVETNIKIQVHLNLTILPISCTWCLQTNCGLFGSPSLPHSKIRLTVHLSEAVNDFHPLVARFHPQLRVQESCLLRGHFLKLSMFLFWVQKSLDCLTMWPLWQAAPHASKRWLTSWQGCGDNTALYGGNSAATQSAGLLLGGGTETLLPLLTAWNKNNWCSNCCTRQIFTSKISYLLHWTTCTCLSHWLVCHSAFLLL